MRRRGERASRPARPLQTPHRTRGRRLAQRTGLLARSIALAAVLSTARAAAATPAVAAAPPREFHPSAGQLAFLDEVERDTFDFFWSASGPGRLTPDRAPGSDVSSVAAVGFALTSYLVGVERGYVTRAEAAARTRATLETLWRAPQGPAAEGVAGHRGLFYHFVDGRDGLRVGRCELSTIDTALLMAGVLSTQAYFDRDDDVERAIRALSDQLYRRVDWAWARSGRDERLLGMGWTPEHGSIDYDWRGYNEGMLLYVLALGSPTHPVGAGSWEAWTRSYRWDTGHGAPHVGFGPLFGHQYSHVWIDFRGIQDPYMRGKGIDYFVNSARATYANRDHCIANPGGWRGYGEHLWGLTASDGPGPAVAQAPAAPSPFRGYWARGAGGPEEAADDGTLAPTAVGGSVPFAPEITIPTLQDLRARFGSRLYGRYGFKDAFNLSYPSGGDPSQGWFDDQYLAIDQGPILLMIENYRTGFLWDLLKKSPYVVAGLRKAGFTGGWLEPSPVALAPAAGPR
jgi:hypothetical protein